MKSQIFNQHLTIGRHEVLANPDILIDVLQELKKERKERLALEQRVLIQRQRIAEMHPKISYYDIVLRNENAVPVTQIAKDYGMDVCKFNELLHELGVWYKFKKTWLLYPQYAEYGYAQSYADAVYWTQKGRLFLHSLLKSEGILPVIEQGANRNEY